MATPGTYEPLVPSLDKLEAADIEQPLPDSRSQRRCRPICATLALSSVVLVCTIAALGRTSSKSSAALLVGRPAQALQAEELRRAYAKKDEQLLTLDDVIEAEHGDHALLDGKLDSKAHKLFDSLSAAWNHWPEVGDLYEQLKALGTEGFALGLAYAMNVMFTALFPFFNFVQGFAHPLPWWLGWMSWFPSLFGPGPKWKPPVKGETMGITSFKAYAKEEFGTDFPDFFDNYYTGKRIPSWEDNTNHKIGVTILDNAVKSARAVGVEPMDTIAPLEPRFAFDNEGLIRLGWDGFGYMGPYDIKYASNGVYGVGVVESLVEKYKTQGKEVLGPLMADSAFSAHLRFKDGLYHVDMSDLEKYTPIAGYAPLGGKATFRNRGGTLHTVRLEYNDTVYTDSDFSNDDVTNDYEKQSKRSGWRLAEGAIIASLLSMTNLVVHVKDLHLELAATFQVVSVDSFATDPAHPVRRLLDPFISRSVQATNDNFKLLFDYNAAEFSLAPLPVNEQLRLISDFIKEAPLNLAEMDMEHYGEIRGMPKHVSTKEFVDDPERWGWRWHYRSLTVQRLFDTELIGCWLDIHYEDDSALEKDELLKKWWSNLISHLPSLKRAVSENPEWAPEKAEMLTKDSLRRVLRTLLVWLSWIHEDVGHAAASYVWNPVYTPMCVPDDGVGVPLPSYIFNVGAYRGFVFLERATLTDEPPTFWFDTEVCSGFGPWYSCSTPPEDKSGQCWANFQKGLKSLGEEDKAFAECEKDGFYTCVNRVETTVSS